MSLECLILTSAEPIHLPLYEKLRQIADIKQITAMEAADLDRDCSEDGAGMRLLFMPVSQALEMPPQAAAHLADPTSGTCWVAVAHEIDLPVTEKLLNAGALDVVEPDVAMARLRVIVTNAHRLLSLLKGVERRQRGAIVVELTDQDGEFRPLCEVESEIIRLALHHHRGHMTQIARRLRIGRSTLYRKLHSLA